jgi:hypothetical protein
MSGKSLLSIEYPYAMVAIDAVAMSALRNWCRAASGSFTMRPNPRVIEQ